MEDQLNVLVSESLQSKDHPYPIVLLRGDIYKCLQPLNLRAIIQLEAQVSLYCSPDIQSPLKNVCMLNTSKLLFKSHTAIGFYVKTMSAHGSHLGWRSWSQDTHLKVYYPRTIHAMFALNWLTGFRREDF